MCLEQELHASRMRTQDGFMTCLLQPSILLCLAAFIAALPSAFAQTEHSPDTQRPPMEELRIEHLRVLDELNVKDADGKPAELDDPQIPELVKHGWSLAGAYAAAYLDIHPTPLTRDLERIFAGFAPAPDGTKPRYDFRGSAVRIGPSIYVVQASYGVDFLTGTFMVVARNHEGHFQALWNIKDLAAQHYSQRDEIGRWLYLVRRAYYNGPLAVQKVLRLSPAANGHARFLVDAYQGADGGTILAQLSIWEWDGAEARPLLVEVYQYAADFGGFRFDGKTLRISTKEELGTLFSCGMCPQPRGVWTVRITPAGVKNLGHRFLQPELQWADELLSKLNSGTDATDIADPSVLEALRARIKELQAEEASAGLAPSDAAEFSWGMLGDCRVLSRGQQGAFVLVLDEGKLRFSYVLRNGRPYFTDVQIQ